MMYLLLIFYTIFGVQATEEVIMTEKIKNQKETIKEINKKYNNLVKEIEEQDILIKDISHKVNVSNDKIQEINTEMTHFEKKSEQLLKEIEIIKKYLNGIIKSQFIYHQSSFIQLLLSKDSVENIQKEWIYYEYLNKFQLEKLKKMIEHHHQYTQTIEIINKNKNKIKELKNQQASQQQLLIAQKKEKKQLLRKFILSLEKHNEILMQLEQKQITQLAQNNTTNNTLSGLSNKINWPILGFVKSEFGEQRKGQINWNGLFIDANEGNPIRSVEKGKVIYSDWLRGYGYTIIIDHGKEYLSLYAHTQELLKKQGDIVYKNEVIALSGQSGNIGYTGLYFEIRHKGIPINPKQYLL